MNERDVAQLINQRLSKIAEELGASSSKTISTDHLIRALASPWICIASEDDPMVFRWYNTETKEWGGVCNPSA